MKKVYDFLETASQAASLFNRYYQYSIDEKGELKECFGWKDSDILKLSEVSFNEACKELMAKCKKDTPKEDSYEYADKVFFIVEEQMRNIDDIQRNVLVSRIIKRSSNFIINGWQTINSAFQVNVNFVDEDEDTNHMIEGLEVVSFYLEAASRFLCDIADLCQDYSIDIKEMCLNIFNYTSPDSLYLSVFETRFNSFVVENRKSDRSGKRGEFTLYRKKEAIITILEALGVKRDGTGAISDSQIKRFIYFLTGNGNIEDDIRNTAVADIFKPSKDIRNNSTINKDLDFVAVRFEEVGLFELAQKIRNGKTK